MMKWTVGDVAVENERAELVIVGEHGGVKYLAAVVAVVVDAAAAVEMLVAGVELGVQEGHYSLAAA